MHNYNISEMGKRAKAAAYALSDAGQTAKNEALAEVSAALRANSEQIISANARDLSVARANGMSEVMLDRLMLDSQRINALSLAVKDIIALPDPVGEVLGMLKRPNGLIIGKKRVPLGVVGIIYESRPNVTVDVAMLCLKSGNACILRGGKEALNTNIVLTDIIRSALIRRGLPENAVSLITDTSHDSAEAMMNAVGVLDLLIPRGGKRLIASVVENAHVPVIQTGIGNCHIYVDASCDFDMGADIIFNAKTSRPSVCNAAETLLVAEEIAAEFLPIAAARLNECNVELRGCAKTRDILGECVIPATEEDYFTEYNDFILAVKVVRDVDDAIAHINHYGTGHSEAIVTNDYFRAQRFLNRVDAAAVYVNASTRFTDGNEFGLGAEVGISTQKIHARGPFALEALTSIKYIVYGEGQIRE